MKNNILCSFLLFLSAALAACGRHAILEISEVSVSVDGGAANINLRSSGGYNWDASEVCLTLFWHELADGTTLAADRSLSDEAFLQSFSELKSSEERCITPKISLGESQSFVFEAPNIDIANERCALLVDLTPGPSFVSNVPALAQEQTLVACGAGQ